MTFGGMDGPGVEAISFSTKVAEDGEGRLWIGGGFLSDRIAVFDSKGDFLQWVGRRGEGPGEFQSISYVSAGPDLVHVFDAVAARRTVYDSDFSVVRTDQLRGQVSSAVTFDTEEVLFYALTPTEADAGRSLHLMSPVGSVRSLGEAERPPRGPSTLAVGGSRSRAWVVEMEAMRLTRWDLEEDRAQVVFERTAAWFDDEDHALMPRPIVIAVGETESGVWILGHAPDPDWEARRPADLGPITDPWNDMLDGIVELVDPDAGRTIARRRLDEVVIGFVPGPGLIVRYREDEDGVPFLDLVTPELRRQ